MRAVDFNTALQVVQAIETAFSSNPADISVPSTTPVTAVSDFPTAYVGSLTVFVEPTEAMTVKIYTRPGNGLSPYLVNTTACTADVVTPINITQSIGLMTYITIELDVGSPAGTARVSVVGRP